ncbi:MAG: hypothetical protein HN904_23210 [Victivallales bacterium]|nr:hypothetical protein [Victivallales bacterium]
MDCKNLQLILLDRSIPDTPEVREHLRACPECRRFAAFHAQLLEETPANPPVAVEQAVLAAAGFRLARSRRGRLQRRLLAMAAALAVLFGWLATMDQQGSEEQPLLAKSTPSTTTPAESVWADGKLADALRAIEEQATLLSTAFQGEANGNDEVPSLNQLDSDLLEFELDFYFERAILGADGPQLNG